MSDPLWRLQDLERLSTHPSQLVRDWARDRLEKLRLGPDASRVLTQLLDDPDEKIVSLTAVHLRESGDGRAGPALLDALSRYRGNTAGNLMMALGRLRYAPALPALLARLEQPQDFAEYLGNVIALAQFGGEQARAVLFQEWDNAPKNEMALSAVAGALLSLDDDTLIARVVTKYLHAPEQYKRLLIDLRRMFPLHWIDENLSAERGFDAVCTELREEYHLPTDEVFPADARTQLARDWGKASGLGERTPIYAQAARAAVERRVLETFSSEYARLTARRLALLDAFAQSRGELTKLDDRALTVRDGQARRYTLRVESHTDRDETRIAERNRALCETAYHVWRATPGPPDYLAPRLIARGAYRDPCPPDPLSPMMERDSRFRIAKPAREETLSPAERRKMAEDRLEEGLDWLDQGNAREAEKSFWKSIVADETFADGYNHLGILTFERGDWHRSAEFYRLALAEARKEFDPNDRRLGWWSRMETRPLMRALHGLGLCQWKQRQYRQAIATFERMMALNPNDNQEVRYLIGVLYHELGQRDQAARWYRQTTDDPHVLFNWALLCFETRQHVDAITHILQGVIGNPYIAPRLLGRAAPRYAFWHATTREEPKGATDYRDLYRHLWKRKGALAFLRAMWSHPRTRAYLAEFIELRTQLTDTKDSERRTALIDAESRLRDASSVRSMARAIARDLPFSTGRAVGK